jgi:hypothetical protein
MIMLTLLCGSVPRNNELKHHVTISLEGTQFGEISRITNSVCTAALWLPLGVRREAS